MEQDEESDHLESDMAEHAPVVPSERESGFHKISLQIDPLMCSDSELPPNRTKGSAQRWERQTTMEYLKTCMQEMTQAPPMSIFRQAEHYSITMELPLEAAKRVLIGSGKLQGIEARPWMLKGSPGPGLEARILWLKAPNMKSSSSIWEILHSQYWFAGVRQETLSAGGESEYGEQKNQASSNGQVLQNCSGQRPPPNGHTFVCTDTRLVSATVPHGPALWWSAPQRGSAPHYRPGARCGLQTKGDATSPWG